MQKTILAHKRWTVALLIIAFIILASNIRITYASPYDAAPRTTGYEISWYTIDGGGVMELTGGTYSLSGTIGQYDAGAQSGGGYNLNGGFWFDIFGFRLFLPIIMK